MLRGRVTQMVLWVALLISPSMAADPDVIWSHHGLEPDRIRVTTHGASTDQKVIYAGAHDIRGFRASDRSNLFSLRVHGTYGSLAISPNNAVFFHKTSQDRIYSRYTSSGVVREWFSYPFEVGAVQIAAESANRIYVLHGVFLDEITKSGTTWTRTWRWDLGTTSESRYRTRLSLVGDRWVVVSSGLSSINVYDRLTKTELPFTTLNPPTNLELWHFAVSPSGDHLATGTSEKLFVYRTSDWTLSSSFDSPNGNINSFDWFLDGDLAMSLGSYPTTTAAKVSPTGIVRWSLLTKHTGLHSVVVTRSSNVLVPIQYQTHLVTSAGNDAGRFVNTGSVVFVSQGDDWIFTASSLKEVHGYNNLTGARTRYQGPFATPIVGAGYGSGRLVWASTTETQVLNPATNVLLGPVTGGANAHEVGYRTLDVSRTSIVGANAPLFAVANLGGIKMHRLTDGSLYKSLSTAESMINVVQFSGSGNRFMALGTLLIIWSTDQLVNSLFPEGILEVPAWSSAAMSPDGSKVVVMTPDRRLRFYRRNALGQWSFQEEHALNATRYLPATVSFSPDGNRLMATGASQNTGWVEIWNVNPPTFQIEYAEVGMAPAATFGHNGQTVIYADSSGASADSSLVCAWNPFRLAAPWSLSTPSNPVTGGEPVEFTVTLSKPSPANGFSVPISTSNPSVVQTPSSVTFNQGQTQRTFTALTTPVNTPVSVVVSCAKNGNVAKMTLRVKRN